MLIWRKNKKSNYLSLNNEYFSFSVIILVAFFIISGSFYYYSFLLYKKEKKATLLRLTKNVSSELLNMFQENEYLLRFFGNKIIDYNNYKKSNYIANLLASNNDLNIKSMTKSYLCWADSNGNLIVNGRKEILTNKIPNIRNRSYFKSARKNPWSLQFSEVSVSFFDAFPILPTAVGIQNKFGKFIGYMLLGLRLNYINKHIEKIILNEKINYILFDNNFKPILFSKLPKNIEKSITKQTPAFQETNSSVVIPFYLDDIKYSYLYKIPGYPFYILLSYDIASYNQDFLYKVTSKLIEFSFIGIFCLMLLYLFKKRILYPITKLSELAFLISKGNFNFNIKMPKQTSIEMFNLSKSLLLVIKYIRKTELYKQKLEYAHQIAKDSDYAKSEFIKKINYEVGSYLKEIFIYSELILQHLHEKRYKCPKNNKIIQHTVKIQELVMFIKNKANNILELSYFNLNEVLEKSIKINIKDSYKKEVLFSINLQPDLPNMYADRLKIKQILTCLIDNSIENSPRNSKITINTNIVIKDGRNWFKINIIDQGFGLSEIELHSIEKKFTDSTEIEIATIFEFTKMNMEFIKKLVAMHRGSLEIINKLHIGREVILLFPLLQEENYHTKEDIIYINNKHNVHEDLI